MLQPLDHLLDRSIYYAARGYELHCSLVADTWVFRTLGLGLDQRAIAAVRQWKFEPATKDGQPVAVMVNVEVQFRLY